MAHKLRNTGLRCQCFSEIYF